MTLEILATGSALGAEVGGIELSKPIDPGVFAEIKRAWHRHIVLLFRDQELTVSQLMDFGRSFGELHRTKGLAYGGKPEGTPEEIEIISNLPEDFVPEGARAYAEAIWHTDMSMFEKPASASILYGVETLQDQGQTSFTNLYRAYETLPQDVREKIRGKRSLHDAAFTAMGEMRAGYLPSEDPSKGPGTYHPIVRTHPETGRDCLFLGRKGYGYVEGCSPAESKALLDLLWAHMSRPEFVWSHSWRNGDVVVWDNRCCAHMRDAFDPTLRRRLLRVTAIGERPFHRDGTGA